MLAPNIFRNTVKPGGFCSIHRHTAKRQVITCLRGELIIEEFDQPSDDLPQCRTRLTSGGSLYTLPFRWHRFLAPSGAIFCECYLPLFDHGPEPRDDDIERFSEGGCLQEASVG